MQRSENYVRILHTRRETRHAEMLFLLLQSAFGGLPYGQR